MRIARAALTFSLLLCAAWLTAGPYTDLSRRLTRESNPESVVEIVTLDSVSDDPEIDAILANEDVTVEEQAKYLKAAIDLRAMMEGDGNAEPGASAKVKEIKTSTLYRDPGVGESSNWLSRALQRLKNLRLNNGKSAPNVGFLGFLGPALYYLAWILFVGVLVALAYFALRHVQWRQRLQRRVSAMLEESEPERSLDEWLEQADLLEAEGKYREAVRALYLACLLRFDEALVARFDRGQTNWEHLFRIEKSPKLPHGLNFRTPTQLFDRVWYGHQVRGREDSQQFRQWYLEVTDALKQKAAA